MSFSTLVGMRECVDKFEGFIVDLWGVTHDGKLPYPGVIECLTKLKELKKPVIFLSNAPRRVEKVEERLDEIGIPHQLYEFIMTSGEDAYKTLKAGKYADLGEKCYYLGPGKDEHLMEGVPLEVVDNVSEADIILATGTREAFDTLEPYKGLLDKAATNSPPMICVNPDYIVHIQGKPMFCAGALASLYEERGGTVFYHGKPHPSVYRAIFDKFDGIPRESFLAIGDSFHTDIQGAQGVGISSAFVPGGIHCKELEVSYGHLPKESLLRGLCKKEGLDPTFVLPGLIWQQED